MTEIKRGFKLRSAFAKSLTQHTFQCIQIFTVLLLLLVETRLFGKLSISAFGKVYDELIGQV